MAVVVTKFRIRSTCAVRVTQARHPAVHVCRQVSHTYGNKNNNFKFFCKTLRKRRDHLSFFFFWCVWPICVSSCRSIDCVRLCCCRLLCLVDRLHVPWNFVTFCRDANAFVLNPGTARIDYWPHIHKQTHTKSPTKKYFSLFLCAFLFLSF